MLGHCSATKGKGPLFRVYFHTVSNALSTLKIPVPASSSPISTFTETQNYTSVVLIFCVSFSASAIMVLLFPTLTVGIVWDSLQYDGWRGSAVA